MPRPRPRIQAKVPPIVEWLLRKSTSEQLSYLNSIAGRDDFRILLKVVENFKDFNVYKLFMDDVSDEKELLLKRAAARGEVAAFDALIIACQAAKIEIERRKQDK